MTDSSYPPLRGVKRQWLRLKTSRSSGGFLYLLSVARLRTSATGSIAVHSLNTSGSNS